MDNLTQPNRPDLIATVEVTEDLELGLVPAWSYSALKTFESCAYRTYISKVKRVQEDFGPAAERGTRIHDEAEKFVRHELGDEVPESLRKFSQKFSELKQLFADGNPDYDCNFFGMLMGDPEVFSDTGEGDYFLPNLNGSFEFAENQIFRFAVSKTNSRPDLEQMRATVDVTPFSFQYPTAIIKGNPDLQPYEAKNLDLAYEYYYAEGSYFAVNYFRKDIEGYHGSQNGS